LGSGGRALRHYALASVLRSTAHGSIPRLAPIPNAVVLMVNGSSNLLVHTGLALYA